VRTLELADVGGVPCDVAVADLSFISLTLVAPALARLTGPAAELVLLVKPQFEAGRERVSRGGIVREPAVHREVLGAVTDGLAGAGIGIDGAMSSPLRGGSGNIEFLVHARKGPPTITAAALDAAVAAAHAVAEPEA
jgi:23S rRNA (cytidine1920-2'-O)/16S rRNA (cytidine1409-2'-O)-methyltransferase